MAESDAGGAGDDAVTCEEVEFLSRGTRCAGTFYRPQGAKPPVVVMAHGFGAWRSFRLPAYAEHFAAAGMAVLLFDYRYLGGSAGEPRDLVSFRRQREDWRAAIQFVRTRPDVDAARVALWGTSYSGGHVIATAAKVSGLAAVVAQAPMVDVLGSVSSFGPRYTRIATWHALRDLSRIGLGLRPYYVPVVGPPDQFAVLNRAGCEAGYHSIVPEGVEWPNRCPARELLFSLRNRPILMARQVSCPALVILAEQDQLIPAKTVIRLSKRLRRATLIRSPVDHFDIYRGAAFEALVAQQTLFFREHLSL